MLELLHMAEVLLILKLVFDLATMASFFQSKGPSKQGGDSFVTVHVLKTRKPQRARRTRRIMGLLSLRHKQTPIKKIISKRGIGIQTLDFECFVIFVVQLLYLAVNGYH